MLHQISWSTYAVSMALLTLSYYLVVGLSYYRTELLQGLYRLTGRKTVALRSADGSDLHLPANDVMGPAQPEAVEFVPAEELFFGPREEDKPANQGDTDPETNRRLISDFSDMVAEVRTLIRVINESSESKENFEMLFQLIIQKYPSVTGRRTSNRSTTSFLVKARLIFLSASAKAN